MNKIILKISVGLIALLLAICAAFFSIVGLSKLFAGAMISVIVMASTLEASKLIIASFLYQHWNSVSKTLRAYLLVAISIIMLITSIGIYGFLSGAYQTTKLKYDLTQTQSDSLSTKQSYFESSVSAFKIQLESKNSQLNNLTSIRNSQEHRASQLINSNRSSNSADRSARQTDAIIKKLNLDIDNLNEQLIAYSDSAAKVKVEVTQLSLKNEISSELGSLSYISKILNVPMDKVVNVLILLFIVVFDPLAICMALAFNFLNNLESNKSTVNSVYNTNSSDIEQREILDSSISEIDIDQPSKQPQIQSVIDSMDTKYPVEPNLAVQAQILNNRRAEKAANLQKAAGGAVSATNSDNVKTY
jgi:hypothetical protein